VRASRHLFAAVGSQPTLVAQAANVVVAIATFSIVARFLGAADFGRYAAVTAAYSVVNGVVGAPLGARTIAQVGASNGREIHLSPVRDGAATLCAAIAVGAVAYIVGVPSDAMVWAAAGAIAWIASEIAGGVALGGGRLWEWGALLVGRQALVLAVVLGVVPQSSEHSRLELIFIAGVLSGIVPVVYVLARSTPRMGVWPFPMAGLGSAQLALWVIAAADRIIFGHLDPVGAAAYAAAYSVIDRGFRTVASAELPRALSEEFRGGHRRKLRGSIARPLVVVPAVALSILVVPDLVHALTAAYRPSYELVAILSCGMAMMTLAVPGYASLIGQRRIRFIGGGAVVIAAGNVVANLFVIPSFGGLGAASVTLISYAAWLGLVRMEVRAGGSVAPASRPHDFRSIPEGGV
jgi:O-antigen/teichoic acid export membrane protein